MDVVKMTKLKSFWARASLAVLIGVFLSVVLLALGRNPFYGPVIAVIFGVWLTQPASPAEGRKAGTFIGGTLAILLALAALIQPAVVPANLPFVDSWIEALLVVLLLTLVGAIYGDVATRVWIAYTQGRGPFF